MKKWRCKGVSPASPFLASGPFWPILGFGLFLVPDLTWFRSNRAFGPFFRSADFGYRSNLAISQFLQPVYGRFLAQTPGKRKSSSLRPAFGRLRSRKRRNPGPLICPNALSGLAHPPNRQRIRTFSFRFVFRFTTTTCTPFLPNRPGEPNARFNCFYGT